MSLSTSIPTRTPSPRLYPQMIPKSQSKSEQLAKAVAEAQASPQISYRPESLCSEGAADVIWHGSGADKARLDPEELHFHSPPPLSSPAAYSTHTVFSLNTDSEFADANEGSKSGDDLDDNDDDDEELEGDETDWDAANTTITTVSTSDSRKGSSAYSPLHSTPIHKAAPPARPKKRVPARLLEQVSLAPNTPSLSISSGGEEDDVDTAANSDGHSRTSSVGSSIWAGRGSRKVEDAPPMPASNPISHNNNTLLQESSAFSNKARSRQSEASSVYSQGHSPAIDWEDSPKLDQHSAGEDKENRVSHLVKAIASEDDGKRRLADGTIIPKMPPMPSGLYQDGAPLPRSRSKKGRQNRSPIMSYADGAEEEERLEQERELQEHGASRPLGVTSSMGPKLKKNSPAPWEMADGDGEGSPNELLDPAPRPSGEALMPPNARFGSAWARQSVESLRNRSVSNGSQSQQGSQPPLPSSRPANSSTSREQMMDSGGPAAETSAWDPATVASTTTRRSRAKSIGAAGMLKGLGLSSNGATKGKIGKALRGISNGNRTSSSSSGTGSNSEAKRYQGISSDDYAHMPPSPQRDQSLDNSPVLPVERKTDLPELIVAAGGKYRDQSYSPSPKKASKTIGLSAAPHSNDASSNRTHISERMTASSPSRGTAERSEVVTPTKKTLSESRSSPALRAKAASRSQGMLPSNSNQGMSQGASSIIAFENTPYKLISLEEARRQQQPSRPSHTSKQHIPSSSSNKSLSSEAKEEVPQRQLKNKKSAFLRRFAKDSANDIPSSHALSSVDAEEDALPEMRSFSGQSLAAPALSLRPMSSIYNGFAPGMLDMIEQDQNQKKVQQLSAPHYPNNEHLSPVLTISSYDGTNDSSRASSQVLYEDATEALPRSEWKSTAATMTLPSRTSTDSLHSTASSVPRPASHLNGSDKAAEGGSLANATRAKVAEIEGKIADLLGELVKLRTLNVDSFTVEDEFEVSPALMSSIAACAYCGCNCADQKRIHIVNQLAASKAPSATSRSSSTKCPNTLTAPTITTSVLSRGRALKPMATADAGKFGSYTNR